MISRTSRVDWRYLLILGITLSGLIQGSHGVVCQHCEKDFQSLGRHVWRCKARVSTNMPSVVDEAEMPNIPAEVETPERSIANNEGLIPPTEDPPEIRENEEDINPDYTCYCGKVCKGLRGLQAHKRSCKIIDLPDIKSMFESPVLHEESNDSDDDVPIDDLPAEHFEKLSGIKLPRTKEEWNRANEYIKESVPGDINSDSSEYIEIVQNTLYTYFKNEYGCVAENEDDSFSHYNEMSNRKLKKALRSLKDSSGDELEIKYVAKLIRIRLNNETSENKETAYDHEVRFRRDYWRYCKKTFEPEERIKPVTSEEDCYSYFKKKLKHKNKNKKFQPPKWMKSLAKPEVDFDLSPPTYQEVSSIVRKMKTSASPCPFDQISVIVLKNCPMMRTVLWRIMKKSWEEKCIPPIWKKGLTILAYKKGPTDNLENFRPITLQPVMLKVLTSWIRNRSFKFLASNKLVDEKLQKGFWTGVSGTVEHTETLSYTINQARNQQRSLCVTLIDLRNAFGEVHHGLIKQVMDFHHMPPEMRDYIIDMYTNFTISVATDNFVTRPISVQRGVLQGDSLSPLLFNMCFNTLMKTVDQERIKCCGFIYGNTLQPQNWLQFADDTTIVTALESDNQFLLNLFTKWCVWADFIIRIDKCHTFGMRKKSSCTEQYLPYLCVGRERIPPIESGGKFEYLGKSFSFSMDNTHVKESLLETLESKIEIIDRLPLLPRSKILIVNIYLYSKIKWPLSCYVIDNTWLKQNCDNLILRYIRKWLNLPIGSNTCHLSLPYKKLGLNILLPSHINDQCRITVRRILRNSNDRNIRNLYKETQEKNIMSDQVVEEASKSKDLPRKACKALLLKNIENSNWEKFMTLNKQNIVVKHILDVCQVSCITSWNKITNALPQNLYCFLRKALILSLPTNKNLMTWNLIDREFCPLCNGVVHTQHHILNNCSASANQQRYLWRHNSVLNCISYFLSSKSAPSSKLYLDLPGFQNTDSLFHCSQRPDLVLVTTESATIVELTICFETNLSKSREYKEERYKNLKNNFKDQNKKIDLIFVEISSLGFYSSDIGEFKKFLKDCGLNQLRVLEKCSETSIRCSYYIFNRRAKPWTLPGLLLFV